MWHITRLARCTHHTTQSIKSNNAAAATVAAAAPGCDSPSAAPHTRSVTAARQCV